MNANELRIGSKVIANGLHGGKIMTVNEIGSEGTLSESTRVILFREHTTGEFVKDLLGIPITPEWLTRAGFEKNIYGYYVYDILEIGHTTTEEYFELELKGTNDDVGYKLIAIKYVHQLQQLYFSLSGKELEFK